MAGCGNVLVIGSEGVGKTTLIREVLGSDAQELQDGQACSMAFYEALDAPFRIIDAGDLGGSVLARRHAVHAIRRWSKASALDGDEGNDVNVIWFCVEGKSRKLIRQQMTHLSRATDVWRSVPIIVVLTKSYSELERTDNIELVQQTCARRRRLARSVCAVVPVVASTYSLSDTTFVAPTGIPELIRMTAHLLPEGTRAAQTDVAAFALRRKRAMARGIVAASVAAGVAVGAVSIPISDAVILTPVETNMIKALSNLYDIAADSASKNMLATILEAGTVSTAAKTAISALKAVPGINLGASVLNAAIAGSVIAVMGEGTARVFERIYCGEKTIDDSEWAQQFVESKMSKDLVTMGTRLLGKVSASGSAGTQRANIVKLLLSQKGSASSSQPESEEMIG